MLHITVVGLLLSLVWTSVSWIHLSIRETIITTGKTYLVSCCYYYYFFSDNEKEGLIKKSLRSDNVEHTHNWVLLRSRATSSASRETISNMPTMHNFSSTAVSLSKTSSSSSFCFWKPLPLQHHLLLSFLSGIFLAKVSITHAKHDFRKSLEEKPGGYVQSSVVNDRQHAFKVQFHNDVFVE